MRIAAFLATTAALAGATGVPNVTTHLLITDLPPLFLQDIAASPNPLLGMPGSVTLCTGPNFTYGGPPYWGYTGCAWLNVLSVQKCLEVGHDNTSTSFNVGTIAPDRYGFCYAYSDPQCHHGLLRDGQERGPILWPGESDERFYHARGIRCERCKYPICEHKDVQPYRGMDGALTDERTWDMTSTTVISGSATVLNGGPKPTHLAGGYNSTSVGGSNSTSPARGN